MTSKLLEALAAELERPRELSSQVIKHIAGHHGVERDDVGAFLENELPNLEDYEIDLIFSPLFTPKLGDQAIFADLLGSASVARDQWPQLIETLAARPTQARLITPDGKTHVIPLREVAIERYVHRLRLDGGIPEEVGRVLNQISSDRGLLRAIARRAVWESAPRQDILLRFLTSAPRDACAADAVELLNLVESYQPEDRAALLARIPQWLELLRQEIEQAAGPKPFFSARIEESHGGDRDQRRPDESHIAAKKEEFARLQRIQKALGEF